MRVLAVFAHPDDELSCIGTLKKHAERGDEVMLAWTTKGELASQFVDQNAAQVQEVREAHGAFIAKTIGAAYHFFDMKDSYMSGSRAEALELAGLYAAFKPDAIITWSDDHAHPDHRMSAKISYDAVTLARIPKILAELGPNLQAHREPVSFYQYSSPAYNWPTVHIDISEQIDTAVQLFEFYRDFYGWQHSADTYRQSRAALGREVGVAYAEKLQLRKRFAPVLDYLV